MEEGSPIESYDAVVVGSGYGGSVAACRMAMEGIKVCLVERGRRWEAQDFPKNTFSLMAAARIEWAKWGFAVGSKKALFQVRIQGDSLSAVACGLGGGSLINAGVMVPTPVLARRDPRWPQEWHKDWEICQQYASTMQGLQSVPFEFSNARVMRQIVGEEIENFRSYPIELSINFGEKSQLTDSCLACGNCLSGCPYNAKNSTDKNYLASAIQDGCVVKTESKVLYILKNPDGNCEDCKTIGMDQKRRWRVYFDDLEYINTDFIILSAGVLGTTEILFQSERRGLSISKRLGLGFSCNGNNVGCVARSQAPLNAYGLSKKQFLEVPYRNRPGPAISSSYTSSLGFAIQSGVLPESYPYLLFKGITTYGWPPGIWLLHGFIDSLKHMMGLKDSQAMVLNTMGYDTGNGSITLDKETGRIFVTAPQDPLLPKKVQAFQNIAKKLGGILFMSKYRSTAVHLLGGCNAASDPSQGVCNHKGQVFDPNTNKSTVYEGLYICDSSLIPCSIGTNPCLTICTVAEHVSRYLVEDILKFKTTIQQDQLMDLDIKGGKEKHDFEWVDRAKYSQTTSTKLQSSTESQIMRSCKSVIIKETMRGFIGGMPCSAYLIMKMNARASDDYGGRNLVIGDPHPLLRGRVGGHVVFQAVSKDILYIISGEVDMCKVDNRTPYTQYMHYRLVLAAASGSRYLLEGKKVMSPYLLATYAWLESRTLDVTFSTISPNDCKNSSGHDHDNEAPVNFQGELHLSTFGLLKSLVTLKGNQRGKFICLLLQSLWRTYILQIPRQRQEVLNSSDTKQAPYPPSVLHELITEDGSMISCRQWKCTTHRYPVLLLNGHSTDSYWLPSEPKDLVRTLLEEGHETWLLQPRLHPLHPSNNFTIEDIGKFDIPAAMARILESNGQCTKIHVIAHCVGGLAIHIALLGGHISATHIASLSCTNSSMFFKLTTLARVKMWLPLVPVTMAILGKNRILSMYDPEHNLRHRLLKSIARLIPRYERCTCDECEIFSGIFGNAFWHENVSETLHHWLNTQNLPQIPLSAFPHLRRICNSGFIVDAKGKNKYLVHPERMPLPTLYISGGRNLLATQETSLLANKFMRLHQPGFHHKRVVVDGFGHSDLLIGEESHLRVFPHFISHMKMAENRGRTEGTECRKESMVSWDGSHDGVGNMEGWGSFMHLLMFMCLIGIVILFLK